MKTLPTWGGVDWFGCEDDLAWEPLRGVPASDGPDQAPATSPTRRRRGRRPATATTPRTTTTRTTTRTTVTAPSVRRDGTAPARRVLILDVENVCPGSRRQASALARLRAVLDAAGPVDEIIAASAASQHARLDRLLLQVGVDVHTRVKNRPDAADRALIQAARHFAEGGDCEVVVASNDHGFRAVASLPGVRRVVLITVPRLATARSLIRVADEHRVAAA